MTCPATYPAERILFVVNPISGQGRQKRINEYIDRYLDRTRFQHQVVFTTERGHAARLARQAAEEGVSIVVAVGGDGTVNEVGQGLVGTESTLGIIPAGSGNGLARHLGLPAHFQQAIEVINRGKRRKIDTATLNGSFFVNMAGMGFDAHVARKFDAAPRRGFFSYFHITTSSYKTYKPKKYVITIDGRTMTRRALLVSFANSSQFGNNTTIAPNASVDDGKIDVCIMQKMPFWKLTLLSPLVFLKKADRMPNLEIIQAREVTVKRKKGRYIHLDGDPARGKRTVLVVVQPLSLHVIEP